METKLGGFFVFLVVSGSLSSAETTEDGDSHGLDIKIEHFQVMDRHPAIRKCIDTILHENKYGALRVNESTGECQGLPHVWALDERKEKGYAYAKKLSLKEEFHPPADVGANPEEFVLPGYFVTGTKLDVFLSISKPHYPMILRISMFFHLGSQNGTSMEFLMSTGMGEKWIQFSEFASSKDVVNKHELNKEWHAQIFSKNVLKISFLAETTTMTVLVDDEKLETFKVTTRIAVQHLLISNEFPVEENKVLLHAVQFNGN